ncbi:hypothetical protein ACFQRB_16130 [Halobaculum litoreum]|uniref:Uncharacterized protein n=1 Tax=Halobaculum litoreum TaxID=3031998 RepID=A0ABD5XWJ5_9EURY
MQFKPIVNEIDELVGKLYGLNDEMVEYLQNYHAEYGRGLRDSDSASLDEFLDEEEREAVATDD